jgi:AI-2 transport protein TqsA
VGALIAVALPMPLVLFNPNFGAPAMLAAFFLPGLVHALVGNVLEPVMFGSSLELHPVVVLLSLMLWSALWGVTGLVLAVPLTAIMRIHLAHVDHPLPRMVLRMLAPEPLPSAAEAQKRAWLSSDESEATDEMVNLVS